jgi:hypothetical protein
MSNWRYRSQVEKSLRLEVENLGFKKEDWPVWVAEYYIFSRQRPPGGFSALRMEPGAQKLRNETVIMRTTHHLLLKTLVSLYIISPSTLDYISRLARVQEASGAAPTLRRPWARTRRKPE